MKRQEETAEYDGLDFEVIEFEGQVDAIENSCSCYSTDKDDDQG